jgi:hypothetical protein
VEKYGRARQATDDNMIRSMRFACWLTKATDTLRIRILTDFPRQQWLRERASMLTFVRTLPVLYFMGDTGYNYLGVSFTNK